MNNYKFAIDNDLYKMNIRNLANRIRKLPDRKIAESLDQSLIFVYADVIAIAWCISQEDVVTDLVAVPL